MHHHPLGLWTQHPRDTRPSVMHGKSVRMNLEQVSPSGPGDDSLSYKISESSLVILGEKEDMQPRNQLSTSVSITSSIEVL